MGVYSDILNEKETTAPAPVQQAPVSVPKAPTVQPKAPASGGFNFAQAANAPIKAATAGLGKVADLLSTGSYAMGAYSHGAQTRANQLKEQYRRKEPTLSENLLGIADVVKSGIQNVPKGIREKQSLYDFYTKDVGASAPVALAADFVLDPMNLVGAPLSKGLSKLPKIGSKVSKVVPGLNKVRDFVGKFEYGYKVPKNFLGKYEELQRKVSGAAEFASKVASPLKFDVKGKELPKTTQKILGDVLNITGQGTNKGVTPEEQALIKQFGPIAGKTLREFGKLAEEQIKLGKDPAIFEDLLGKYYGKRMYASKLGGTAGVGGKTPRLDLSVYKKRQDIPEEVRNAMGEIKEPAYGAAVSAFAEKKNVELTKFFRWVAKKYVDQGENLVKLPETKSLGPISGRMVPKEIADYVNQTVAPASKGFTKTFEDVTKFFKKGKTVGSVPQLARNAVSSQIQAYLNPGGSSTSFTRIPEAIKEIKNKGKYYQELKKTGEIGSTFVGQELNKFIPDELSKFGSQKFLSKVADKATSLGGVGPKIQQFNEEMSKLQVYINERKLGKTIEEARKAAETTGFNYQKVSPTVAKLRKGAVPFLTFPLKASALAGKTLAKNPERLTNVVKTERSVERTTSTPDERFLPSYQSEGVRIGEKDKRGSTPYLNTKYLYPWGNLGETTNLFGLSPSPLFTEAAAQLGNKDLVTGQKVGRKDLVSDFTDPMALSSRVRHAAETFGPRPLRSALKIGEAALRNPNNPSRSTTPNVTEAIIQELGVPYFKYSPAVGAKIASKNKRDAQTEARYRIINFRKDFKGQLPDQMFEAINQYFLGELRKINTSGVEKFVD